MTILSIKPNELANQRKLTSDALEAVTSSLTIANKHAPSSHGQAAHENRDKAYVRFIERKKCETDESYLEDLFKEIE